VKKPKPEPKAKIIIPCPECGFKQDGDWLAHQLGQAYVARRKNARGGTGGGRPRTIKHEPDNPKCRCADCRNARTEAKR
jgi:hypothetical protein